MLTVNSVRSGFPLADFFADRNLTVVPVYNTVMSELVNATTDAVYNDYSHLTEGVDKGDITANIEAINSIASVVSVINTDNNEIHNKSMDLFIKNITDTVRAHIHNAKNVVTPLIVELAEKTKEAYESDVAKSPISRFNLICVEPCPLLDLSDFTGSLSNYENKEPAIPRSYLFLKEDKPITVELIKDIVIDSYPEVKDKMIDWFQNLSGELINVESYLGKFLGNATTENKAYGKQVSPEQVFLKDNNVPDILTLLNINIVLYLLACHLYDNVEYGTTSLNQYKDEVANIRNYAGVRIVNLIKRYDLMTKGGTVILNQNSNKYTVYVNGPLYRDWLTKDGKPEYIYASIIKKLGSNTIPTLMANKDSLMSSWRNYLSVEDVVFRNLSFSRFKEHLKKCFIDQLQELTDLELSFNPDPNAQKVIILNKLEEKMTHVKMSSMDDVYKVARKLICRCRFYFTSAERIIESLVNAQKANENISANEAALIATIEYVADFVAEQLTTTSSI